MKLKDILELETYGYNPDCKVEIFDIKNFEERLENEGFHEISSTFRRERYYSPLWPLN